MNIRTKLSGVALGLLLLSGCNGTAPEVKLEKQERGVNQTEYTSVLERTNGMIQVFYGQPMNIGVADITNKTAAQGKLPLDITDIVNTSFNKIGDYVNTLVEIPEGIKGEVYVINGAITEYDVIESVNAGLNAAAEFGGGKGASDTSGDFSKGDKIVKLAINFNPSNIKTKKLVSRTSTSNRITIHQKTSSNSFAFSILGSGFGFNNSLAKSHGIHSSITMLVELSVAEVLGKLGKFPYWLLTGGKVNNDVVGYLKGNFLQLPLNIKIEQINYLLGLRGYDVRGTTVMNAQLKKAIIDYKSTHGMTPNEVLSKKLYISLLKAPM